MPNTIRGVPVEEIREHQDPATCTPEKLRHVADSLCDGLDGMGARLESALMWLEIAADAMEQHADHPAPDEGESDE